MDPWLDPAIAASRARLRPWLELQRRAARKPEQARRALEDTGNPRQALGAFPADPVPLSQRSFEALCDRLAAQRIAALPWGHPDYPPQLTALSDPPVLLWVQGQRSALAGPVVAIVGSRAATGYGRRVARTLARAVAARGIVVSSGLARGIDAEAHRGALEAGTTVAVLPCGPDAIYPASHRELARAISRSGALLSEFAPGTPPLRHHFPLRNRIISGLAAAVVVVEARARSGSLLTAAHALNQGREVLAVPGPIDVASSEGPNALLRAGAGPALDVSDVLGALGLSAALDRDPEPARAVGGRTVPHPRGAAALLEAMRESPASPDELVMRLGLDAAAVARHLVTLELEGRIEWGPDGRAHATSLSSPPSFAERGDSPQARIRDP